MNAIPATVQEPSLLDQALGKVFGAMKSIGDTVARILWTKDVKSLWIIVTISGVSVSVLSALLGFNSLTSVWFFVWSVGVGVLLVQKLVKHFNKRGGVN